MKIALLGQFGSGNYGNDGSLTAMVATLRRIAPGAELMCICSGPGDISRRLGIAAVPIGAPPLASAGARRLNRLALRMPQRLRGLRAALAACRGVDAVIVPGTGILDDFNDRAMGWPFVLLRWCLAARLSGARLAFVSIGAGPIRGALSRRFLRSAAALADMRSYRDEVSRDFMATLGFDTTQEPVFPDLALGLPAPAVARPRGFPPTVAVGMMTYRGWRKDDPGGEDLFRAYLGKMEDFVRWLIAEGCRVHLIGGDDSDGQAVAALLERIDADGTLRRAGGVSVGAGRSLETVMEELSRCDLVVASRFHNVLCALRVLRPTLSIGYADKNRALMTQAGLGAFCLDIESFEVETLKARFRLLRRAQGNHAAEIERFVAGAAERLAVQEEAIRSFLDRAAAGRGAPGQPAALPRRASLARSPSVSRARASGRRIM
ncbi:polysaccharide pyruvyl transferase family protein [Oceaniglobus roseus]|uniref:polysaccharide pyruvyl transferase family protein n=1 Tax=Oceaniglobus roseus TaxID=1737570 RepID=UPI0012FFD687|nr:polysaccharide pyruvyl transferase family protein [Kandeliimicrobium roseum]